MKYTNKNTSFFDNEMWDIETPIAGHEKRFIKKLGVKNPKKKLFTFRLVASIVFMVGSVLMFVIINQKTTVELTAETQQTQDYFTSVIEKELVTLKSKENEKTKKIITDALSQLKTLENDYELLKTEIAKNGENKQLIYALLTNMQTRITFIQNVLAQIENINQLKINQNETTL